MYGVMSYNSIAQYVADAVGEMGYGEYAQEEYAPLIKKAKKAGVRDIEGWLADHLYNDAGIVCDLAGDKLYEYVMSLGENPRDKKVWSHHVDELQKYLRHVSLDGMR